MRKAILVFGGLGDPEYSVVGFYSGLFDALLEHYDIIAIDPVTPTATIKDSRYSACYSTIEHFLNHQPNQSIACAMLLTPVSTHLMLIKQLSSLIECKDLLFVVEKPSFALHEVDEGFGRVIPRLKAQGNRFYFIDTALVTPSMEALFDGDLLTSRGQITKLVSIATDNPVELPDELSDFQFDNRIQRLNARGVLDPNKNGGAGYGLDMGIHAVAGLVRFLQKSSRLQDGFELKQSILERIDYPGLDFEVGVETHLYSSGILKGQSSDSASLDCEVVIESGKAGDIWDRRLEVHFVDSIIAIGFGTIKHPPYLWVCDKLGSKLIPFDGGSAGYKMHFNDILAALGFDKPRILNEQQSEDLMDKSMRMLNSIFDKAGENPVSREPNIKVVAAHQPKFLSEGEQALREQLTHQLNNLIRQSSSSNTN
ncbi:hypothetical protein [Vibrio gallicus]|uniref:hypothetical protein n=1 Tax=Vibrio gallicus TaxID=190897 RepID=UPI0021C345FE|nr:hypothetical protein [Vibrio gallicus]